VIVPHISSFFLTITCSCKKNACIGNACKCKKNNLLSTDSRTHDVSKCQNNSTVEDEKTTESSEDDDVDDLYLLLCIND
jgi:hypothetical protein